MDLLNPFGGAVCWVLMTFRTDRGERAFIAYGHVREDGSLAFDTVTQGPSRYSLGAKRVMAETTPVEGSTIVRGWAQL